VGFPYWELVTSLTGRSQRRCSRGASLDSFKCHALPKWPPQTSKHSLENMDGLTKEKLVQILCFEISTRQVSLTECNRRYSLKISSMNSAEEFSS
jgi:hypothetical protein